MSMSSIPKGLIIYRGSNCNFPNHPQALKYGLQLNFTKRNKLTLYNPQKLRILQGPIKKRLTGMWFQDQSAEENVGLIKDIKKVSEIRKLQMTFFGDANSRVFKSETSLNSQITVDTDEGESDNELDVSLENSFKSSITNLQDRRNIKRIFQQAKGLTHCDFKCKFLSPGQYKIFSSFSLATKLESCKMKILIRHPKEISGLRDLLKAAKQRNLWPNIKSMNIKLRHSYNAENCSPRFIHFCQILQEITAQDLPWVKIQLKVKCMWRLNESAINTLKETLQKAQNQFVGLSLVTDQPKRLTQFFKTVEELKDLQKFSVRFNDPPTLEGEDFLESLKKLPSLKQFKVQGRYILDSEQNSKFVENLGDLSHLTSFSFKGGNKVMTKPLWDSFSKSILKLPQLQVLVLKTRVLQPAETSPDVNHFLDFFTGLKSFHNLQTFVFDTTYNGCILGDSAAVFQVVCEVLQNQKELRKIHINYPWTPNMNSDLQELTKVLPKLQNLEDFNSEIQNWKWVQPVENDVFLRFAKTLCGLKEVKRFGIRLEIKEINDLTYEAALLLFKCFRQRNARLRMTLASDKIDEEAFKKLEGLAPEIYLWRVERD